MEDMLEVSESLIHNTSLNFKRYLFEKINWKDRLIGIKGARGTGKTTLLLQWLKEQSLPANQAAYFSLDELYFTTHSLVDTAKNFYQQGGKILVLDEVHKYPPWSREVKNLYDRYDDLRIVFTGSSIIDIAKQEADLSRRALIYELQGMSFREYLSLYKGVDLPVFSLKQLLDPGFDFREELPQGFKPLLYFKDYLKFGYYPFYAEYEESYHQRIQQLVRTIVEYDMAELKGFDVRNARKMLQLIYVIAQQVPFKPNIKSLSDKTKIHRNTISNYLLYLHQARLIHLLYPSGSSVSVLQKPEKVFLDNTNLLYAIAEEGVSMGTVREVFFNNQLSTIHEVNHSAQTDFEVDRYYHFEVGGKNKTAKQISNLSNTWLVKDDMEYPVGRSIPLWLFGLLY